jgi:hypothetical protein
MVQLSSKISEGLNRPKSENLIPPGEPLRLREGVYKQLKDRDWLFKKFENDTVVLIHASRAYGIAVRKVDIDWEVSNRSRSKERTKKVWNSTRDGGEPGSG